jgi:hypothetical protein
MVVRLLGQLGPAPIKCSSEQIVYRTAELARVTWILLRGKSIAQRRRGWLTVNLGDYGVGLRRTADASLSYYGAA